MKIYQKILCKELLNKTTSLTAIIAVLTTLTACQTTEIKQPIPAEKINNQTNFKKHKDMIICPMYYDPVCATLEDSNGNISHQTYSNGCTAQHANNKIFSVSQGACE